MAPESLADVLCRPMYGFVGIL